MKCIRVISFFTLLSLVGCSQLVSNLNKPILGNPKPLNAHSTSSPAISGTTLQDSLIPENLPKPAKKSVGSRLKSAFGLSRNSSDSLSSTQPLPESVDSKPSSGGFFGKMKSFLNRPVTAKASTFNADNTASSIPAPPEQSLIKTKTTPPAPTLTSTSTSSPSPSPTPNTFKKAVPPRPKPFVPAPSVEPVDESTPTILPPTSPPLPDVPVKSNDLLLPIDLPQIPAVDTIEKAFESIEKSLPSSPIVPSPSPGAGITIPSR